MIGSFLSALLAVKVFIALMGRVTLVPFGRVPPVNRTLYLLFHGELKKMLAKGRQFL